MGRICTFHRTQVVPCSKGLEVTCPALASAVQVKLESVVVKDCHRKLSLVSQGSLAERPFAEICPAPRATAPRLTSRASAFVTDTPGG